MNVCWLAGSCSVRGGGGDGGDGDGESSMRNDWWVTKRRMGGREGEATDVEEDGDYRGEEGGGATKGANSGRSRLFRRKWILSLIHIHINFHLHPIPPAIVLMFSLHLVPILILIFLLDTKPNAHLILLSLHPHAHTQPPRTPIR